MATLAEASCRPADTGQREMLRPRQIRRAPKTEQLGLVVPGYLSDADLEALRVANTFRADDAPIEFADADPDEELDQRPWRPGRGT
jgi:hypothetical protein